MPIAFDAAGGTEAIDTSSIGWTHTVGSIANGIILVGFASSNNGKTPTGVTDNGVAMTALGNISTPSGLMRLYLYYKLNPSAGAHSMAASVDAVENYLAAVSTSYSGVSGFGTAASLANNSTSISVDVSSASGELVVDWCHVFGVTPSVGAGQTQRAAQTGNLARIATSDEAGAGTVTMSWTTNQEALLYAIPLKPVTNTLYLAPAEILVTMTDITFGGQSVLALAPAEILVTMTPVTLNPTKVLLEPFQISVAMTPVTFVTLSRTQYQHKVPDMTLHTSEPEGITSATLSNMYGYQLSEDRTYVLNEDRGRVGLEYASVSALLPSRAYKIPDMNLHMEA